MISFNNVLMYIFFSIADNEDIPQEFRLKRNALEKCINNTSSIASSD